MVSGQTTILSRVLDSDRLSPDPKTLHAEFERAEAELLCERYRLFAPVGCLGITATEIAPFFSPEFPAAPILSGSIIALILALYVLAGRSPSRARVGYGVMLVIITAGAYIGTACAETGNFDSPHVLGIAVLLAFISAIMTLTVYETCITMLGAVGGWAMATFYWLPSTQPLASSVSVQIIYIGITALVCLVNNFAARRTRFREFRAKKRVDALHRFAIEEVLCRHLPPHYVEYVLSGEQVLDAPAERRVVTVIFADIVGFSKLVDGIALDTLEKLMAEVYDQLATIAFSYGATIDKFIGDAAMAIVGAPDASPLQHQAIVAYELAEQWHQTLDQIGREVIGHPLALRVGIHQGEVAVGSFGGRHRVDYTVLGREVNIAARLEPLCRPGEILVSEPIHAHLNDGDRVFESRGALELKGVLAPTTCFAYRVPETTAGDQSHTITTTE